jgi:hypothetical protein
MQNIALEEVLIFKYQYDNIIEKPLYYKIEKQKITRCITINKNEYNTRLHIKI